MNRFGTVNEAYVFTGRRTAVVKFADQVTHCLFYFKARSVVKTFHCWLSYTMLLTGVCRHADTITQQIFQTFVFFFYFNSTCIINFKLKLLLHRDFFWLYKPFKIFVMQAENAPFDHWPTEFVTECRCCCINSWRCRHHARKQIKQSHSCSDCWRW